MLRTNNTTTSNKIKFCSNCGCVLTGKQRTYCSDKCRKAFSRKADKSGQTDTDNQSVSDTNNKPLNIFALFADNLSGLDRSGLAQLKTHLLNQAKYSDEWIQRIAAGPVTWNREQNIIAQQALSDILWRLLDDIQALEVTQ